MAVGTAQKRCLRCGTIIRNRAVCPCCGCEEIGVVERPAPGAAAPQRAVPGGTKMCPVCLGTVPEDRLIEMKGQFVCAECHKTMSK